MDIIDPRLAQAAELEAEAKKLRSAVKNDHLGEIRLLIEEAQRKLSKISESPVYGSSGWSRQDELERDLDAALETIEQWSKQLT